MTGLVYNVSTHVRFESHMGLGLLSLLRMSDELRRADLVVLHALQPSWNTR